MKYRLTIFTLLLAVSGLAWKMATPSNILDPEFRFGEFSATVSGTDINTSLVRPNAIQLAINPLLPKRRIYLFAWTKGAIDNTCAFTYKLRISRNQQDVFVLDSAATPFFAGSPTRPFTHIFQPTFANAVQNLAGESGNLGFTMSGVNNQDCITLFNAGSPGIGDFGTNNVFAVQISPYNMTIDADQLNIDITNLYGTPNMIYAVWAGVYSYE